MAYIATKATYIGEEVILDKNGKPVVDENNVPVKRIQTDVDDVIFTEGEVIVLIEKINEGQHFDLSIEDEGSTYFAPTQIKIGDGFHSFKELNWLQTVDNSRVESDIDKSVEEHTTNLSKAYTQFKQEVDVRIGLQNQQISTFVNVDSRNFLRELVKNNYFSYSNDGVLSAFSKDDNKISSINDLKSFAVGKNNIFSNTASEQIGSNCVAFGNSHNIFGNSNYSFGYNSSINGYYVLSHGYQNVINTTGKNQWTVCFGKLNQINNADSNFVVGEKNTINSNNNFIFGKNNISNVSYSFIFGENCTANYQGFACGNQTHAGKQSIAAGAFCNYYNRKNIGQYSACFGNNCQTIEDYSFACGYCNDGENKLFSVGNGTDLERSNIFDIDTNGKATFYGDLEIMYNGNLENIVDIITKIIDSKVNK